MTLLTQSLKNQRYHIADSKSEESALLPCWLNEKEKTSTVDADDNELMANQSATFVRNRDSWHQNDAKSITVWINI